MQLTVLILTILIALGLVATASKRPATSGDNVMGGLVIVFWGIAFAIATLVLLIVLGVNNAFDWLGPMDGSRLLLLLAGWVLFVPAIFFSAVLQWEGQQDFPKFVGQLASTRSDIWLSALALAPVGWLIVAQRAPGTAPQWVTWLLLATLVFSGILCAGLLYGSMSDMAHQAAQQQASAQRERDQLREAHRQTLLRHGPNDPLYPLLTHTSRYADEDIREAALEKIRSRPDWESQLIDLLHDQRLFSEVYPFLDSNAVDHPERFVAPLKHSIATLSAEIQHLLTDTNNLQTWSFDHYRIDRLLNAIDDQFNLPGVDFRPDIEALCAALDAPRPERFAHVRLTARRIVGAWLEKTRS